MNECIDWLGNAQVFWTLDANSGYWQIEVDEADRDYTAFVSHHGLYRYKRMPFGLRNAPSTFQRAIDIVLASVKWRYAIVYLDDIIVFSNTVEENLEHLTTVLTLLRNNGITLKLKKCASLQRRVDYLRHVVSPGELHVASKTVDAVRKFAVPHDITSLRSFLGLCKVYRRFVKNIAEKARPPTDRLKKAKSPVFEPFNEEKMKAYESLKENLINPPTLAIPRSDLQYVLDIDASNY